MNTRFAGRPMSIPLAGEMLGRIFGGAGQPIDGLGPIYAEEVRDINGNAVGQLYFVKE